jgi:hypothetical protein
MKYMKGYNKDTGKPKIREKDIEELETNTMK